MQVFEDVLSKLELNYKLAKANKDDGAAMRALDLIHQTRIREYEVETLMTKIKEQQAEMSPKVEV
jgi:hypothetical protein